MRCCMWVGWEHETRIARCCMKWAAETGAAAVVGDVVSNTCFHAVLATKSTLLEAMLLRLTSWSVGILEGKEWTMFFDGLNVSSKPCMVWWKKDIILGLYEIETWMSSMYLYHYRKYTFNIFTIKCRKILIKPSLSLPLWLSVTNGVKIPADCRRNDPHQSPSREDNRGSALQDLLHS